MKGKTFLNSSVHNAGEETNHQAFTQEDAVHQKDSSKYKIITMYNSTQLYTPDKTFKQCSGNYTETFFYVLRYALIVLLIKTFRRLTFVAGSPSECLQKNLHGCITNFFILVTLENSWTKHLRSWKTVKYVNVLSYECSVLYYKVYFKTPIHYPDIHSSCIPYMAKLSREKTFAVF